MQLLEAELAKVMVLENKTFHTVFIAEKNGSRHFPIEIGLFEAIALLRKIEPGNETPRPMTHDLLVHLMNSLGGNLREVRITNLKSGTFFAELVIDTQDGEVIVDARPSDALVIAASEKCSFFVAESVFETVSQN